MDTQVKVKHQENSVTMIRGIGVNDGKAAGRLRFIKKEANYGSSFSETRPYMGEKDELSAFYAARETARGQISEICRRTAEMAGGDAAAIFEIHDMLLTDPDFTDGIGDYIRSGMTAGEATRKVTEEMAAVFEGMDDEYLRGRAADMRDVGGRVADILYGKQTEKKTGEARSSTEREIIVSYDLTPGETATLDTSRVCGIVTSAGSMNSHSAILARALGIPAIVRAGEISEDIDGKFAIIDASEGTLVIDPSVEQLDIFDKKQKKDDERRRELEKLRNLPAITKSGKHISLYANIGNAEEVDAAYEAGAEGIGLFRSEFLFLGRSDPPSEEEQYRAYRRVLEKMAGRQGLVVVRTLDIGADKILPYLPQPHNDNPALGVRGIRLCLQNEELFRTQLRALCRASVYGNLGIMLPMITSADEVRQTRCLLNEEKDKLRAEGTVVSGNIPLGVMIETPASVVMAKELAREADFFSVGTNDLCQYTFAADRQDPDLLPLMTGEENLEAVFRLIKFAAGCIHAEEFSEKMKNNSEKLINDTKENGTEESEGGKRYQKWIGICGELAADTTLTRRLIECGADELSVSPPYLLAVKETVREVG